MNLDKYIERLKPVCKVAHLQSMDYVCPECNNTGLQPIDQPALILDIVESLCNARRAFEEFCEHDRDNFTHYLNNVEIYDSDKTKYYMYRGFVSGHPGHYLALALKNLLILCGAVGVAITIDIPADVGSTLDEAFLYMIGDIENIRAHEYEKTYIIILYHRLNSFATYHGIDLIKHLDALLDHEGEKDG